MIGLGRTAIATAISMVSLIGATPAPAQSAAAQSTPAESVPAQRGPAPSVAVEDRPLVRLVEAHATAVVTFDQATLAAITAPDYVEISPVGDVDTREAMLGFYAPANKIPAPSVVVSEPTVDRFGDAAVMTARLTYTMPTPPGADMLPPTRAMRAGYVARRVGKTWQLVSAQFTPIRTAPQRSTIPSAPPQK